MTHKWITLDGCYMTVIDVAAYKQHRWLWKIRNSIAHWFTLWTILLMVVLAAPSPTFA